MHKRSEPMHKSKENSRLLNSDKMKGQKNSIVSNDIPLCCSVSKQQT